MTQDRKITCLDCGAEFNFTAADQERHARLGFRNEPKRCAPCRAARKVAARRPLPPRPGAREMHPALCSKCGLPTQVPFKPRGDKPIFCTDCYSASKQQK